MKTLCIANAFDRPEAHLLRGLRARGIEVRALVEPDSSFQEILRDSEVEVDAIALRGRFDLPAIRRIRSMLHAWRPDVVHSFSARALSAALWASLDIPVHHVAYRGTMGNVSRWDPGSWMTFLHPRLERIICVSDAVRTSLCAVGIAAHKLQRIYKGHDPVWYRAVAPVALSEFSIPPGAFVVCCVANMRELKGVDTLIEAFASIPADLPIHLLLVGEVRDPNVREWAARVDARRIHFAGYRADASAIVSAAALNALLSRRREGLPKGIIEGMAQSVPAIVSAVGGMPELVRDGIDGLVVAPDRPEAVAEAILRFFRDPPFLLRARIAARERIERDFHISGTIEQTAAVYQELVSGKRGHADLGASECAMQKGGPRFSQTP